MNNLFIPYQQALDLKELGFDEECFAYYLAGAIRFKEYKDSKNKNSAFYNNTVCSMPTFSQAFRFFRDKGYAIMDKIFDEDRIMYAKDIIHLDSKKLYKGARFNSYEESELECLKQLIKLERR